MTEARPRLLLGDEDDLFRAALRTLLTSELSVDVVAEASNGKEAIRLVEGCRPDLALLQSGLPDTSGTDVCRTIREQGLATLVVIIGDRQDPDELIATLEAGADGYLAKDSAWPDLASCVRAVLSGQACVPPRMLGGLLRRLIDRRRAYDEANERYERLSRREREVLTLLTNGEDHDSIAATLVISPQTARTHIQNVLGKLQVHSRLEAASFALEHGLP